MGFQEPGSSTAEVRGQLQIARDLALFTSGDTTKGLFEIVLCFAQYGDTCLQFKLFRGLRWRCTKTAWESQCKLSQNKKKRGLVYDSVGEPLPRIPQ